MRMADDEQDKQNVRFRLDPQPLGCGTFGCVYRAHDTVLDRVVAVKIPHDELKEAALRGEAKLMARIGDLNEEHVVRLHDLHDIGGRDVLVMEFVEGATLRSRIGNIGAQRPLTLDMALDVAIQTCLGLAVLHRAFRQDGVFHRDVKPENLLIRAADGLVKIADFGIARVLDHSGYASTATGTLPYMAPETLNGQSDCRADVYGLGVVLYEMITGQLPFSPYDESGQPKPPLVFGKEICGGDARPPGAITAVPEELDTLTMRAIACDVGERLQEARELHDLLIAFRDTQRARIALDEAGKHLDDAAREKALKATVDQYPSVDGFRALAKLYTGRTQPHQALRVLRDGLSRHPACGELLFDLAMVYEQLGRRRQAVDTLTEARAGGLPVDKIQGVDRLLKAWQRKGGGV